MDYWNDRMKKENGEWMNRGDLTINFLLTWKAAGIPAKDTLKALTINGFKAADVYAERGPIKAGLYADFIAVAGNPLEDIDALRNVVFVMKNGEVFKKDGAIVARQAPAPRSGEWLETTMTLGQAHGSISPTARINCSSVAGGSPVPPPSR